MRNFLLPLLVLIFLSTTATAQMSNGRFGNEWIQYDQSYYKLQVTQDGVYRLTYQQLRDAGIPIDAIQGRQFQLFLLGDEQPLYVTQVGTLGQSDYLEFFGRKNRSELDREFFSNPDEEMLNPDYSLYTDTSAYFLTWNDGNNNLRYDNSITDLSNLPGAESYCWVDQSIVLTEKFQEVKHPLYGNSISNYGMTEGFSSKYQVNNEAVIEPEMALASGPSAKIRVRVGTKEYNHQLVLKLNGTELNNESFNGYAVKQYEFQVPTAGIATRATIRTESTADQDENTLANVHLIYPRSYDFSGKKQMRFALNDGIGRRYLEIQNFDNGGGAPVIYDLTNNMRVSGQVDGSTLKIVLPGAIGERNLFLFSQNQGYQTPASIQSVNFINYTTDTDADYIIISHRALYNDGNGNNYVQQYANYRNSIQGGAYTPRIIDIQQLYDQFAYGLQRHPLSIRNFAQFIKQEWESARYLLIMGKGREYPFTRKAAELSSPGNATYYIPTYGYPGSDNLLVAANNSNVPLLPVGRIAASTADDIRIYLKKVKDLENTIRNAGQTIEDKAWMKNVMHLSGGGTNEQQAIASSLGVMENIIENNDFGAEVTSFFKTSTDPVQISTSERIFELINDGVSIITFFGHSGVGTFDFNIDNPENYSNFGKYPFMASLGCYSGNIHTPSVGVSERFLFYEDKAAIAFAAATGTGFVSTLSSFMQEFYRKAGNDNYGGTIAEILSANIQHFNSTNSSFMREMIQQFTFHGDPVLRLNPAPGPDYVVDAASVVFEPGVVSTQLDSFAMTFDVVNLGRGVEDSMVVKLEQEFPDGTKELIGLRKIKAPENTSNETFNIPIQGTKSVGLNRFYATVDAENEVAELPDGIAEMNNELQNANGQRGQELYIADNSFRPVYPPDFAIHPDDKITLKASTGNSLAKEQKYIFEIDTTELFNSPFKQREEIIQSGGVVRWEPDIVMTDSTVYYWRVSPDSASSPVGYVWENRSFTYLPGSERGWSQSHYYQYQKNDFDGMSLNGEREFEFWENGFFITIRNKVRDVNGDPAFIYNLENPANSVRPWNYLNSGLAVFVGDSITGGGWINEGSGMYGSVNVGRTRVFAFPTSTYNERLNLMNFLENVIPSKNYVYVFTVMQDYSQEIYAEEWEQDSILNGGLNIFNILEKQGASQVRKLKELGTVPYTVIYQKDEQLVLDEDIAESVSDIIVSEVFIPVKRTDGNFTSAIIGPARNWKSFKWNVDDIDSPLNDSVSFNIIGIDLNMNRMELLRNLTSKDTILDFIDATQFPNIQIQWISKDEELRTPAQLNYWRITYEGLPESAVNPSAQYTFYKDTLQQGEQVQFSTQIENVSDYDMDSLLVRLTVTSDKNSTLTETRRLAPLTAGQQTVVDYNLSTSDLQGNHSLIMEVNPNDDQPELYHFNNFVATQFEVERDRLNPLLDVTFDGIHIMNGDIISPRPEIQIQLKDENPYFPLNDTALFRIFLAYPNGEVKRVAFADSRVDFFPASGSQEKASVIYRPELMEDGRYELLVQAEDATGNQSGDFDFKVEFEVVNKKAISQVLNYPNPFSTSTRFVYTLTGEDVPDYFKIQIITVSGKVVREISEDEIGPLKIGTHQTDFAWDGTDTYGDKLANGVYLYRVVAKSNDGSDYEMIDTGTNAYFKNGIGKMVIIR